MLGVYDFGENVNTKTLYTFLGFYPFLLKGSVDFLYNASYFVIVDLFNLGFFLSKKRFLSGKTVLYVQRFLDSFK